MSIEELIDLTTPVTADIRSADLVFMDKAVNDFLWGLNEDLAYDQEGYGGEIERGFHPSSLYGIKCLRKLLLDYFQVPTDDKGIDPRLRRIFDNGNDLHDRWQRYFTLLSLRNPDIQLVGSWRCKGCGYIYSPDKEVPYPLLADKTTMPCPTCKSVRWKYGEYRLRDKKLRISGKRDGKLIIRGNPYLLEIKSINTFQFQKLMGAVPAHITQLHIYMFLDSCKSGLILYEDKNCVPEYARILTDSGWKFHEELVPGVDKILTYSIERNQLEWELYKEKHVSFYKGNLIKVGDKYASWVSTEDHSWYVKDYKGRGQIKKSNELNSSCWIPVVAPYDLGNSLLNSYEAGVLGLIVTDGWIRGNVLYICQKDGKKNDQIKVFLGNNAKHYYYSHRIGCENYYRVLSPLRDKILSVYKTKQDFPRIVTQLNIEALESLVKWMLLGDGSYTSAGRKISFGQRDGYIKEGFQIAYFLLGCRVNINKGKVSCYVSNRDYFRVLLSKLSTIYYEGEIWCPITTNGYWVMEQDGKVIITGNTQMIKWYITVYKHKIIKEELLRLYEANKYITEKKFPDRLIGFPKAALCKECQYRSECGKDLDFSALEGKIKN